MNDNDLQLIASLIGGELSATERTEALARIQADPELRAAYDEQVAVASMLQGAPPAVLSVTESDALRAALRAQLNLTDTAPAVAAAGPSMWARWWVPLTGLAAAALVVVALVVVPDLAQDDFQEVGAVLETTVPTAASEPVAPAAEEETATDGVSESVSSTTAAAALEDAGAMAYVVAPEAAEEDSLELPVVDPDSLTEADFTSSLSRSVERGTLDGVALADCFASSPGASELTPVGLSEDRSSVYAYATDPATTEQTLVLINLATCEVAAG